LLLHSGRLLLVWLHRRSACFFFVGRCCMYSSPIQSLGCMR
jgi:hypothetical protein